MSENEKSISVYEKICVCQNARVTQLLSEAMSSALHTRRRLDLNVDPSQISGKFRMDEDEMIQVGDEVEPIPRPQDRGDQGQEDQDDQVGN